MGTGFQYYFYPQIPHNDQFVRFQVTTDFSAILWLLCVRVGIFSFACITVNLDY